MALFEYARRHAKAFLFTIIVLVLSGIALMLNMPISLFPDITFPRIVILADNGEEPAERMMVEVTKPLEEVASSIPGVTVVRSITGRGSTELSIGLEWGSNILQTLQLLQGRIANIRNQLPASASVQAEQMSVSVFPIHGYSLTSDTLSLVELRDIALYQIRPALMKVRGVARVEITGGDTREFHVTVSPEKLEMYRLDIRQVSDAIEKNNFISSTGLVDNNYQLYLSLVSGLLTTVDDIRNVTVVVENGVPIKVSDIAEVKPSVEDKYIRTTAHGRDAVLINIIKQPTGSTVQIGRDVTAEVARLNLPAGVHFENFYDQGAFIMSSIASTRDSIIIGVVLAMAVIFLFLRSWRISLVILLVVPTTIAATFACLSAAGLTVNIMTLGGIAAAVGLIIDDSIVVIEHIFTHFNLGTESKGTHAAFADTASTSLRQLMPAIAGSTASTIVIHIPLAFLGGVTGAFFASLSITVVLAMLLSFVFSISLAPLLAMFLIRKGDIVREVEHHSSAPAEHGRFRQLLRALLRHRWVVVPIASVMIAATYFLYKNIGSDFMPEMDEGTFVLDYTSPPGTSLNETNRMLMQVEKIIMATPEVESYSRRTGTQLGFFLTEVNNGDYLVKLKKKRSRSIEEVMDDVRTKIESNVPSLQIDFGQLMMDVIGDLTNNPSPIEIKLFGEDADLLHKKADEVTKLIETVPGVVDAFDGLVISGPSLIVDVDAARAARAGLVPSDIRDQLETMMRGEAGTMIQKGEKLIAIRVRFPSPYRTDIDKLNQVRFVNSSGALIPLSSIATIRTTTGQAELDRERLRQFVAVTARISQRDLGTTVDDIKRTLSQHFELPKGMSIEFGGVYQTQQESFRGLLLVAIAAFMLVFIVLLFEFGEFAVPVSIFIVNLMSLFGVLVALWITGITFNISSFVGIIMIIGIVAENAIFVLHEVKVSQGQGMALDDALVQAVSVRVRPILMTTLAAVFALLPLSLGIGAGAQMQQPLAIAVIGGFSVSSVVLFFGLPLIYRMLKR
ncbi:MAG TPA: efflux RND transporter permease subunit [Bacteroidota bacterium]|nr:efflux RND transporter permease subunit [Bacteroidota bacterium]